MGLADREYMQSGRRGGGGGFGGGGFGGGGGFTIRDPRRWRATTWLIVINVGVYFFGWLSVSVIGFPNFVLPSATVWTENRPAEVDAGVRIDPATEEPLWEWGQLASARTPGMQQNTLVDRATGQEIGARQRLVHPDPLLIWGHFSTHSAFTRLEVWRFVTFQFLHGGFWHLALNMIALYSFGYAVEARLGSRRRFTAFYLACGIFGAALYLLLNVLGAAGLTIPGVLDVNIWTPLIGASAGVFGVLMAAAKFRKHDTILLFLVLPMKVWVGAYLLLGASLLNLLYGGFNQGGEAAHVGGALAGMYLARKPERLDDFFDDFSRLIGGSKKKGGKKGRGGARDRSSRKKGRGGRGEAPLTKKEEAKLDAILGKVGTQGMGALTADEVKFLESAREKKGG